MNGELILVFFLLGIILVGGAILLSNYASPKSYNLAKFEPYECGIPVKAGSWIQFNVGYYLFALIYLIFDIEVVFIFPWGVVMREMGTTAVVELLIVFGMLGLGLLYAYKKKALKWE